MCLGAGALRGDAASLAVGTLRGRGGQTPESDIQGVSHAQSDLAGLCPRLEKGQGSFCWGLLRDR